MNKTEVTISSHLTWEVTFRPSCCNGLRGARHQGSPTQRQGFLRLCTGGQGRGLLLELLGASASCDVTYVRCLPPSPHSAAHHSLVVFLWVSFEMEKCIRYIASHLWFVFHSLSSVFVRAVSNSDSPIHLFFRGWCCWWHMTSLTVTVDLCISPAVLAIFASNILTLWY